MAGEYRSNGSAAYSVYTGSKSAPRPEQNPKRLPDAKVYYPPEKKTKAKLKIAPLTVLGTAVVAVLLFFVVFHHASLYEAKMAAAELRETRDALLLEQEGLLAQFEQSVDMKEIEARARELGMSEPSSTQIVPIHVNSGIQPQEQDLQRANSFSEVFAALCATVEQAQEYLP